MTKIIAFGSSFIHTFISLKSNNFEIVKFKGALIKGLVDKNKNYIEIVNKLHNNKYDYAFFMFGTADCNFYYYRKKYIDNENGNEIIKNMYKACKQYVKLIHELPNVKNKYIFGVSPPTLIKDSDFLGSLKVYGVLSDEEILKVSKNEIKYDFRLKFFLNFNSILEKESKKYKDITFCNTFDLLVNKKNKLEKIFRLPHNKYNIHYNFEAVLIVLLNTVLKNLCNGIILDKYEKLKEKIKQSYDDYIIQKIDGDYKLNLSVIEKYINKKIKS
jgi:hypothetical protein